MEAPGFWVSQISFFVTRVEKSGHGADFLQPRRVSCSDVEKPLQLLYVVTLKHRNLQQVDVEELEEKVELLQTKLAIAAEAAIVKHFRQDVKKFMNGSLNF